MKEMSYIADKFEELGVIPVVVLENTKDALPLAKALMEGGLPCAEVTFRTEAAQESIRLMAQDYPDKLEQEQFLQQNRLMKQLKQEQNSS